MDTVDQGFICPTNPDPDETYPLAEVRGFIYVYLLCSAPTVMVKCHCGKEHWLAPGELVEEAQALGYLVLVRGDSPSLDHVLTGKFDLPVWVDPDRPLSDEHEQTLSDFAEVLDVALGELLMPELERTIQTFADQLAHRGARGIQYEAWRPF